MYFNLYPLGKRKFVSVHVTEAYEGMELQLPSFLAVAIDTGDWSVKALILVLLLPGEKPPWYSLNGKLIGSQSRPDQNSLSLLFPHSETAFIMPSFHFMVFKSGCVLGCN